MDKKDSSCMSASLSIIGNKNELLKGPGSCELRDAWTSTIVLLGHSCYDLIWSLVTSLGLLWAHLWEITIRGFRTTHFRELTISILTRSFGFEVASDIPWLYCLSSRQFVVLSLFPPTYQHLPDECAEPLLSYTTKKSNLVGFQSHDRLLLR